MTNNRTCACVQQLATLAKIGRVGSRDCMIQQFYDELSLGFSFFCGYHKCFIGAVFCLLVKKMSRKKFAQTL
jgi:hypothetical protein